MSTVFVDTSAAYALIMADDANHTRAVAAAGSLEAEAARLVTTSYVLLETVSLLLSRGGPEAVRAFHEGLAPLLEVIWLDGEVHERAMSALLASRTKGISLTDFTSFVVMRERRIETAFAFDADFRRQGFRLLP